jgi:hypothetical protein
MRVTHVTLYGPVDVMPNFWFNIKHSYLYLYQKHFDPDFPSILRINSDYFP